MILPWLQWKPELLCNFYQAIRLGHGICWRRSFDLGKADVAPVTGANPDHAGPLRHSIEAGSTGLPLQCRGYARWHICTSRKERKDSSDSNAC